MVPGNIVQEEGVRREWRGEVTYFVIKIGMRSSYEAVLEHHYALFSIARASL